MKILLLLLLAGGLLLPASPAPAQNCGHYYNLEQGGRYELTTYDSRDRVTGRIVQEVGKVTTQTGKTTAQMHQQTFDKQNKLVSQADFTVECQAGLVRLDMRALFNPQGSPGAAKGANVQVTGDLLELPANLQPGTPLKNGSMTATMSSQPGLPASTTVISVTNRKVESNEALTTAAGSFKCAKISQDMEVKMGIGALALPFAMHTVEWYSPGVGPVRSETYRKDKLLGYTVLTSAPR
ncbi:TapB family protein [Hymenobacter rubripertinctus]|uniref:DUF3108 domain-containing protein n=1 Tax=Hymenobacter rubripertinctus TaxID=2029981 RepID=A0A418QZZ1_9BACT|nr:hypothetical protein [Hymenobacter rubripertinctus]RIY10746.1 hypothetical protein D0T11_08770 [Hymenobacter rubripertinctus]